MNIKKLKKCLFTDDNDVEMSHPPTNYELMEKQNQIIDWITEHEVNEHERVTKERCDFFDDVFERLTKLEEVKPSTEEKSEYCDACGEKLYEETFVHKECKAMQDNEKCEHKFTKGKFDDEVITYCEKCERVLEPSTEEMIHTPNCQRDKSEGKELSNRHFFCTTEEKCPQCGAEAMVWSDYSKRIGYCYRCAFNTIHDQANCSPDYSKITSDIADWLFNDKYLYSSDFDKLKDSKNFTEFISKLLI